MRQKPELLRQALSMRANKATLREISETLGVSPERVRQILDREEKDASENRRVARTASKHSSR